MLKPLALDRWSSLPDAPLPRAGSSAGVVGSDLIVAGGTFWADGVKYWTDRVDAFDLQKKSWRSLPSLPDVRGDLAAVVLDGEFLLVGGGTQDRALDSVVSFQNGTWVERPELRLPEPRRSAGIAVLADEIFLLGGLTAKGTDFHTATRTFWSARRGAGWQVRAPMPEPARFGAAVAAVGERVLVAGGCTPENGAVRNLDTILAYDPAADRWENIGRLPEPLRGASAVAVDERLLMFGGYTTEFRRDILAVDGAGGVAHAGVLPVALADARFVAHGGQVFGVTGEDGIKRRFPGFIRAPLSA